MEKTTKMVEEISQKRKMTPEVKDNLNKRILINCLIAIGIIIYICTINAVYIYASPDVISVLEKVFPMIFMALTIGVFEVAYRKDSGKIAVVGIELMVCSILIMYIPQIYANFEKTFCIKLAFMPIFFAIYYIAKSIIIYKKTEKHYQNNLSDVKEIVKEEVEV